MAVITSDTPAASIRGDSNRTAPASATTRMRTMRASGTGVRQLGESSTTSTHVRDIAGLTVTGQGLATRARTMAFSAVDGGPRMAS